MSGYTLLNHTLDVISKSSTDSDVWDTLFSFMKMCRVEALVYHHQPPPGSSDFGQTSIVKQNFGSFDESVTDIIDHVFNEILRDEMSGLSVEHFWDYKTDALETLLKDTSGLDSKKNISGVTFPVHGALGRSGYFSLLFGEERSGFSDNEIRVLKWACQNTHQAICKIIILQFENNSNLTQREVEILSWIARGKSNSVIAEILSISPHTVNTYVRRIFLKTNTNDRTSACLYGISNGLIRL